MPAKKKEHYRLMVIGGGTAGLRTALYAAGHGYKTVLIEPSTLGGTCLNKGCIPTKAMLHASRLFSSTKKLNKFGVSVSDVRLNFKRLMDRVHSIINIGQNHIKKSINNSKNLTLIRKHASFVGRNTVKAGNKLVSADKIIICTGSDSLVVPIHGLNKIDYLLSDDIIKLKKMPRSLTIIGGGYISMEFATFFNDLGCKVTILERHWHILGMLDDDVTGLLTGYYTKKGVNIITSANIKEIRQNKGIKQVIYNNVNDSSSKDKTISSEQILLAIGRVPVTSQLHLKAAGIKTGKKCEIKTDSLLQTTNPNVYAIGDVNGKAMFAHAAKRESYIALQNILHKKRLKMGYDIMPWAVFTDPPVSGVGLSEREARQKKFPVGILKANFTRAGRATVIGDTLGFVKVIYNKKTNKILGVVIVGQRADDLVHEFVAVMNSKSPTIETIKKTIHVHPTLSEVMAALR